MDRFFAALYTLGYRIKDRHDQGATMVEYALIVVAIGVVVFVAAQFLGNNVSSKFESIGSVVNK